MTSRRDFLFASSVVVMPATALAQGALDDALARAVSAWTQGAPVQEQRVKLDIAPLVDNGNSVPVTITVDSPMTRESHVTHIAVLNEKNPQRDVVEFTLTPAMGVARISTRIRLAQTQRLVAVARMSDGSHCSHTVSVLVTQAACIEDD